ncbi:MAG: hypothetical protein ABIO05_00600 [Ferruginibacter sp.]
MNNKKEILAELEALAPALISLQSLSVYDVPDGFFTHLSNNIIENIKRGVALEKNIASPYSVPTDYFTNLAGNIIAQVKENMQSAATEIKALSPALSATGNDNVFTVPRNYFNTLAEEIVAQVTIPAKVVSMKPRSLFVRYAAAAVITGILGLSTFSIFNNKTTDRDKIGNSVAISRGQQIIASNSFDKVLATVSDEEIEQYLKNEGQDVKAAIVASTIDYKDLPAADDYLYNENTLNNYLESLHIQYNN